VPAYVDAAEKQSGDQNGRIGKRGSQIGLLENEQHGNTHRQRLEDVLPRQAASAQVGKVARHGPNQYSLTHSEG